MGTSQAAKAPTTVGWAKVSGSLMSPQRNAGTVLRATLSAVVPWIPAGYTVAPIVSAVSEGVKFALLAREKGFIEAAKIKGISYAEEFAAFAVTEGMWKIATASVPPQFIDSPYGRIAEIAFKKTMNSVLIKGIKAMEELK